MSFLVVIYLIALAIMAIGIALIIYGLRTSLVFASPVRWIIAPFVMIVGAILTLQNFG